MTDSWAAPTTSNSWQGSQTEPPAFAMKKKVEPAAVTAFVLALSSVFVWYLPAVVALFLAHGAKRNIKAAPDSRKGKELAIAAQLISLLTITLTTAVITAIAVI